MSEEDIPKEPRSVAATRALHRFALQWTATCVAWAGAIFVFRPRFYGPLMFPPLLVGLVVVLELVGGALRKIYSPKRERGAGLSLLSDAFRKDENS